MFIWFYYLPPLSTASLYLNGLLGLDTKLTAAENPPCSMNTKLEPGIHIVGINDKLLPPSICHMKGSTKPSIMVHSNRL